jgi:hypothetical protein
MVRRNKLAFAAAGVVAATVLPGLVFSSWEAIRATKSEQNERIARLAAEQSQTRESKQQMSLLTPAATGEWGKVFRHFLS